MTRTKHAGPPAGSLCPRGEPPRRSKIRAGRMGRRIATGVVIMSILASGAAAHAARQTGPAGSTLIVEENHAVPLVHLVVAAKGGASSDVFGKEGTAHLAALVARHGAGKKSRVELDAALDALGASLDVDTDGDAVRFEGAVLARNLDAYLAILADVVLRPDFAADEFGKTKREVMAGIDEMRNDDQALCARFFARRAFGNHPYGRPVEGTPASLDKIKKEDASVSFKMAFVGKNMLFAAAGDVAPDDLAGRLGKAFGKLKEGPVPRPPELGAMDPPKGWTIQIVDKPERKQTQLMFGHPGLRPADPDYVPLQVALSAFGGHGMRTTLMHELRVQRGLTYGAYASLVPHRHASLVQGWVFPDAQKTVDTLKLALSLYKKLMETGLDAAQLAFWQRFLVGGYASQMDDPAHRLEARVAAELAGLPPDHVDTWPAQVRATTLDKVKAAVARHVKAKDLAITMVATASSMKKMLVDAKIKPEAIEVEAFDDPKK